MKNFKNQSAIFIIALLSLTVLSACANTQQKQTSSPEKPTLVDEYPIDQSDFVKGDELIKDIPKSELSEEEIAGLILMREEEKLARDVYNTLGKKWGMKIFTNIAKSEQTHTDAIKVLLDRYNIDDPVKNDSTGAFTSPQMDKLYKNLVKQGNATLLDGLIVGGIVEDLDIKDLNELLTKTDKADIITTYNNLNKGSRNHLRAYIKQITNNGGSYSPQYISQTEFDNIISSAQERGRAK